MAPANKRLRLINFLYESPGSHTISEIADTMGATKEYVSKTLSYLIDERRISMDKNGLSFRLTEGERQRRFLHEFGHPYVA